MLISRGREAVLETKLLGSNNSSNGITTHTTIPGWHLILLSDKKKHSEINCTIVLVAL